MQNNLPSNNYYRFCDLIYIFFKMKTRKVCKYTLDGKFVTEYDSIKAAAIESQVNHQAISRCCAGERTQCHGFIWVYSDCKNEVENRARAYGLVADEQDEIWKWVVGYENLYQVSNLGRVKSIERRFESSNGERIIKEKLLAFEIDKDGYKRTNLRKNGVQKHKLIHRLVCEAFIPNTNKNPEVNHINGIKYDNRADNLEWCTRSQNEQHAYDTGLAKGQKGCLRPLAKKVKIVHIFTRLSHEFGCIADCARFLGGKQGNTEASIRYRMNRKPELPFMNYLIYPILA